MTFEDRIELPAVNPVLSGFNPDPSICRVGNDYFLATSSFEYFPGVPIYHSTDLINWKLIGHALSRPSQLDMRQVEPGGGVYAPTLRYSNGRFYMATCCVYRRCAVQHTEPRGFYVSTSNIWDETSWSDPIYFDNLGIDQDIFFDDDGKVYYSCTPLYPIRNKTVDQEYELTSVVSEIDLATGSNKTAPVISRRSTNISRIAEGSHIFKRQGWYYLTTAEGGTMGLHHQCIYRSINPLGPFEEPPQGINPVLDNGDHPKVRQTGHADFVEAPNGQWWAVFLAIRPQKSGLSQLGRETFLAPVTWTQDGWPIVNGGKKIDCDLTLNLRSRVVRRTWKADFTGRLDPELYRLRTPVKPDYCLTSRPGWLCVQGNPYTLDDIASPAAFFRKQQWLCGTWNVILDYCPDSSEQEAGLTVYWSCFSYMALLIKKNAETGKREIALKWSDESSDDTHELCEVITEKDPIQLQVVTLPTSYTFSVHLKEKCYKTFPTLPSSLLTRNRKKDSEFTGTFIGIFAQGTKGSSAGAKAYFKNFTETVDSF